MSEIDIEKGASVIFSFQSRWYDALMSNNVEVFFRKRAPRRTPRHIFVYVGSPVKKIIGYAKCKKIAPINLNNALSVRQKAAINQAELSKYFGYQDLVNAIWISQITFLETERSLIDLNTNFNFHPPQSFSNVNVDLEEFLLGAEH
jgi:predicted transcriptional regulator